MFAYTIVMHVGGVHQQVDHARLCPTLVIASSLVLAIRTAKWPRETVATGSEPEWDAEVEHSVRIAKRVLSYLLSKSPDLFQQKDVPWYQPEDDESPT
jgi:hypothetical protein